MAIQEFAKRRGRHILMILMGGLLLALWFAFVLPFVATELISETYSTEFVMAPSVQAVTIIRVQSNSGEQNGGTPSITMTLGATPAVGNLLVASITGGEEVFLPSGWSEAVRDVDGDNKIAYKIAGAGEPSPPWTYTMASANQTAWVIAEYSSSTGWPASPATVDVTQVTTNDGEWGPDVFFKASGTTAVTSEADSLAFASWRGRGGVAASGKTFNNGFNLIGSAIAASGQNYSEEAVGADKILSATGTQGVTYSWTSPGKSGVTGAIAVFKPSIPCLSICKVQQNSWGDNASSVTMSLNSTPTEGNLIVATIGAGRLINIPSGWAEAVNEGGLEKIIYKIAGASEPSSPWTYTMSGADQSVWVVAEYSSSTGWPVTPVTFDVGKSDPNSNGVLSKTSGTTIATSQASALAIAGWKLSSGAAITSPTWTNGFILVDSNDVELPQAWSIEQFMAEKILSATGTQESTFSWSSVSKNATGAIAVFGSCAGNCVKREQEASNDASASTVTSLATTITSATAGNLLVTAISIDKSASAITIPSGFTLINDYVSGSVSGAMAYKIATGGETSVQWTWTTAHYANAWVGEYSGLSTSGVLDKKIENDSGTSAVTLLSTGTTASTTQADELAIAMMASDSYHSTETGRAWTNDFTEQSYRIPAISSGRPGLSISEKMLSATGTVESMFSTTDLGDQMYAGVATFGTAPPNNSPTITGAGCSGVSYSDSPDLQTVGSNTTFCVDFNDADSDAVKVHVCKSNAITPSGTGGSCTGGTWKSSASSSTTPDPKSETYTTQASDVVTSPNTYYVFVCDVNSGCSGTTGNSGTFSVNNAPPTVTTSAGTHITPSSGRLHGTVSATGGGASIAQVQQNSTNSAGGNSTTATATLLVGATSGNLLVTALAVDKDAGTVSVPSGFTMINTGKSTPGTTGALAYKVATGGETAIQWSYTNLEQNSVWAAEYSGIDSSSPLDRSQENGSAGGSVTSISTGTTVATTQADELSIAMVAVDSWDGYGSGRAWTQSFSELVYEYDTGAASPGLGVASKTLSSTGTVETTLSTTSAGDQVYATVVTFKVEGSSTNAYFRYWTSNPASCSASGYTQTAIQAFSNPSSQAFSEDIALAEGQSYWYCAFADNGTLSSGVEQTFTAGAVGWYTTGGSWLYRKKITIDNARVISSNQLKFPVLVDITGDPDLQVHLGQTDGGDIVFTGPDGTTKLDHEVELVDKTNGDLVAWVEVDKSTGDAFELLNSVDTVLYMYYGDATVVNQWNVTGTWNNNYVAVYHMSETPTGSTIFYDSTVNGNDLTFQDVGALSDSARTLTDAIGYGIDFPNGSDDEITGSTPDQAKPLTYQVRVRMDSAGTSRIILGNESWNNDGFRYGANSGGTNLELWTSENNGSLGSLQWGSFSSGTVYDTAVTLDSGTNGELFVNGSSVATDTGTYITPTTTFSIAGGVGGWTEWDGLIDEVRVSSTNLSADWIATDNNTMDHSVTAFYALGAESVGGPIVTTLAADNITSTTADLNGTVNPNGTVTNGWFRYSESPGTCSDAFGIATAPQGMGFGTSDVALSQSIATLTKNTTYYFCAIAEDTTPTKSFGSVKQFTTTADAPTEVVTDSASVVQAYSATLWGRANPNNASTISYFRYSNVNPSNCADGASGGSDWGTRAPATGGINIGSGSIQTSFSQSISGLVQNTTYYFCAFAGNSGGTSHAGTDVESFTTLISLNDAPTILNVIVSPVPASLGSSRVLSFDDRYTSLSGLSGGTDLSIDSGSCDVNDNVYAVQYKWAKKGTADGTPDIALTLANTPIQNNLLVAIVSSSDADVDITGPAGWTQAIEQIKTSPNRVRVEIWYRIAGAGDPTTLTFNQAVGLSAPRALAVYEVAGMVSSNVLDKTQGENSGTGVTAMSPGPTTLTAQTNELAFIAIVSDNNQGWSHDFTNGFTFNQQIDTGGGGDEADTIIATKLLSTIEAVSTTTSWNVGSEQASVIATFNVDMTACNVTATTEEIRIAYYDETATSVVTAKYVGDASGSCTNTDWDCETIAASGGDHGEGIKIAYDAGGDAWVAYQFVPTASNATLMVAQYVGSGGTCATNYGGSAAWNCTVVDDPAGAVGITSDSNGGQVGVAFDTADNPWVSYYDVANTNLKVAHYVGGGSGIGCSSGSSDWTCESVDGVGVAAAQATRVAVDGTGTIWVAYRDNTNSALSIAKYVGGGAGSGCSDNDWICETLDNNSSDGKYVAMAIHPGTGFPWVSYAQSTPSELQVARYTGSGSESSCTGGSSNWICSTVDTVNGLADQTTMTFTSTGTAWISAFDEVSAPDEMFVAEYVGIGGSCSNTAWDCTLVHSTQTVGTFPSIAVDSKDVPWFSYGNNPANQVFVAKYVGSAGTGCEDTTKWTCTSINTANYGSGNLYTSMAIRTGTTASSSVPTYIQEANGGTNGASTTVSGTYGAMPTAGNMLIVVHTSDEPNPTTIPAGWTLAGSMGTVSTRTTIAYKVADSSDQGPWTFTIDNPEHAVLSLFEYSGLHPTSPVDIFRNINIPTAVTSATPDTDWDTNSANELLLAVVRVQGPSGGWDNAWTNSFTEKSSVESTGGLSSAHMSHSIADRTVSAIGTYETTETWTNSDRAAWIMVSFRAASESWTQPTYRGGALGGGGGTVTTDLTINVPDGTQSGDVMVAFVGAEAPSSGTWQALAGWTKLQEIGPSGGEDQDMATYYRVANGSEPLSYTFVYSVATRSIGGISTYYDIDTTGSVVDVSGTWQDDTWDTNKESPSLTTTVASTLYVAGWAEDAQTARYSGFSAGMIGRWHNTGTTNSMLSADEIITSTGATGQKVAIRDFDHRTQSIAVALICDVDCEETVSAYTGGGGTACDPASWYDCDWQYRKKITVDHEKVGEGTLTLPGLTTDYVSTPDKASLDITGDIDIRFKYAPADWTSSVNETIVAKWNPDSDDPSLESWNVWYAPAGDDLKLYWKESGGTQQLSILSFATEDFPPNDGSSVTARITLDVDNGGQWQTNLYRSNDDGATWGSAIDTQTGSTGISSIYASTHDLYIGRASEGGLDRVFTGDVYWVEIRDGINGTVVADPDFTNEDQGAWGLGSGTDGAGNAWTINGSSWTYNAPSDMTNFPLYLDLAQLGSQFFSAVNSDGGDIRITTSDKKTEIAREVVSADTVGDTGEVYFLAPTISASADTDFYVYFGNSAASDYAVAGMYGRNTVWTTAGYVGVWHLEEVCADGVSGCIIDSTGQNNATAYNFQDGGGGTTNTTGKIGGAVLWESGAGADDYIEFPTHASRSVGTTYSVSAWAKPSGVSSWSAAHTIFSSEHLTDLSLRGDDSSGPLGMRGLAYDANGGAWPSYDCDDSITVWEEGKWDYVGMTVSGTDVRVYENSSRRPNQNSGSDCTLASTDTSSATSPGYIGMFRPSNLYTWEGVLDEVRFSDVVQSEEWMHTEYNGQSDPTTFAIYATTEASSSSGSLTSGMVTSLTLDTRAPNGVGYNSFMWNGVQPAGTSARFWVASSKCPNGETNPPDCTTPRDPGVYETFTGNDGDPWDSSVWTSEPDGIVELSGNWGRLYHTASATSQARVRHSMEPTDNAETLFRFRYENTTGGDALRVYLRASDDWDSTNTANPTTGYAVEYDNALNRFRLYRVNAGALTQIGANYISTESVATDHQWIRFRVDGNQIKLRTWRYLYQEPTAWQIEATDSSVSGTGVLQMSLSANGTNAIEEVIIDDLYVSNPAIGPAGSGATGGQWEYRGVTCSINGTPYTPSPGNPVGIGCENEHYNDRYFRYRIQLCAMTNCSGAGQFSPSVQDIIVNWSR